jgi:hypothetical protein
MVGVVVGGATDPVSVVKVPGVGIGVAAVVDDAIGAWVGETPRPVGITTWGDVAAVVAPSIAVEGVGYPSRESTVPNDNRTRRASRTRAPFNVRASRRSVRTVTTAR